MTLKEAEAYINETPKFTKKHSLAHTRECLKRLGDPQKRFRIIHVAGTNGKGSTCAFLASILRRAGYRCALFTSPHLVDIREQFQIGEEYVEEETFLTAFQRVRALSEQLEEEGLGHPTYFEMLFLMGMLIFAEKKAEIAVLETGLGGRLDATTAAGDPEVCVITSVSLDHMQYLGNTVEEIAGEKAGILVPGVPVVFDADDPAAARVIEKKAEELGCPCFPVKREDTRIWKNTPAGIDFSLKNDYYEDTDVFSIPFIAAYQVMNASLALTAAKLLKPGRSLSWEVLAEGLARTVWAGRMETVLPGVILEGAHNEDGVAAFVETAEHFQKDQSLSLLFSAVEDKDYRGMVRLIAGRLSLSYVVTTQVGGPRQVDAEILAQLFRDEGCGKCEAVYDPARAFRRALSLKGEGMLFCVGSLYLVGEIKKELAGERLPEERQIRRNGG